MFDKYDISFDTLSTKSHPNMLRAKSMVYDGIYIWVADLTGDRIDKLNVGEDT